MNDSFELPFEISDPANDPSRFKTEKPQEGLNYYKIMPPYGTNHGKKLFKMYMVHWGFIGRNGKERSYQCSFLTEGYCPVCQSVFDAQSRLERAEQNGNKAEFEECKTYVDKFKARRFVIYNAVNLQGRAVKLEIPFGLHKELYALILKCVAPENQRRYDPTHPDTGVWFEIERSGKGFKTRYKVAFREIEVESNGDTFRKVDRSPLPLASEMVDAIKRQIQAATKGQLADGPLADIHCLYDAMTAKELSGLMSGAPATPAQTPKLEPITQGQGVNHEIERLRSLQKKSESAV